ncbi:hypothetical protein NPIL_565001 [Nephila pilipes]|uniref:Uncharacterized protein n=1 Tax=Nephila pilipes TaxID=299642 RepID=A0A8X6MT20_NEPPI|nr:hypothetical protein NPIL_565001 [Nephila pilipes]
MRRVFVRKCLTILTLQGHGDSCRSLDERIALAERLRPRGVSLVLTFYGTTLQIQQRICRSKPSTEEVDRCQNDKGQGAYNTPLPKMSNKLVYLVKVCVEKPPEGLLRGKLVKDARLTRIPPGLGVCGHSPPRGWETAPLRTVTQSSEPVHERDPFIV